MKDIIIRRPVIEELGQINEFFVTMLEDTYKKNGLEDLKDMLADEIRKKEVYINQDLTSNGRDRYFLLAELFGKIIGCIEYGPSNEDIRKCTNNELKSLLEVGTVYVHPDYQRKGISSLLLREILLKLESIGVKEFCLDSGFPIAQKVWTKRFGTPTYFMKDYWTEGYHHMIWRLDVKSILKLVN